MKKYLAKVKHEKSNELSVCFYIEQEKILQIGDKMNEINAEAYMNGENWDIFLAYYLRKNNPDILHGMRSNSEAGMCCVEYEQTSENEAKADKLIEIIESLVENEQIIYAFLKKEGGNIGWD